MRNKFFILSVLVTFSLFLKLSANEETAPVPPPTETERVESLAKLNIQYLENRTNEKIRKEEVRIHRYREKLQSCENEKAICYWTCKIEKSEEKMKLLKEFLNNLHLARQSFLVR